MYSVGTVGTVYPANRLGSAIETQENANHTNIISPDYATRREMAHTEYNGNAFQLFARCRQIPSRITSMMTIL
jgi:NAD-dependent SIR2 family protein deacetylase